MAPAARNRRLFHTGPNHPTGIDLATPAREEGSSRAAQLQANENIQMPALTDEGSHAIGHTRTRWLALGWLIIALHLIIENVRLARCLSITPFDDHNRPNYAAEWAQIAYIMSSWT